MKPKVYVMENNELVLVERRNITKKKVLYTYHKSTGRKKNNRTQVITCDTLLPPHQFGAICLGRL